MDIYTSSFLGRTARYFYKGELPGHFRGHFSNPGEFEKGNHLADLVYCLDGSRVVRLLPI